MFGLPLFYRKYRNEFRVIGQSRFCNGKTLFQQLICHCNKRQLLALSLVYDALIKLSARPVALAGIDGTMKQEVAQFFVANLTDPATAAHAAARLADGRRDAHIAAKLHSGLELGKPISHHDQKQGSLCAYAWNGGQ